MVKASVVFWAILLLFGVLVMAYGYFNSQTRIIAFGVMVTGVTSMIIFIQVIAAQKMVGRE